MSQLQFDKADQLREFFFAMLESIPGGLLLADRQGRLLAANRQAAVMLGVAGVSIAGRSCWELLGRALALEESALEPLRRAGGRLLAEQEDDRGSSGPRYLLIARNELQSPFFDVGGFFLSLEDVTYPAMVEDHLHRRKRFAAIKDLAVSLSQELRNPLGGLELYASMLERDLGDDPDYRRITGQMLAAIRTMNHLLDNVLTFAAQPRPEKKIMAVKPWLEKVLAALVPLGETSGVRFTANYGHRREEISGDPAMLEQMMLNLGLNALESMPRGGEVELVTRSLPGSRHSPPLLEIRWIDRGRGIAAEERDKIFDPFFSTKDGGKGLGLAIVHHIVESHEGFIRVDSVPGRGSVFKVFLPENVTWE
ncbi:two-component system sensor histidine kinase NtrB [Desulfurivibrio dismutans]|uniref:two-component system sensor histidine kinase NtrB n=1 Tax=Desulfurivibrio dismutans TaxID=1398908 RepID=UPI0023DA790D|nr:ATP-binding protein [Desulfurivibrio alkaliphilus]MDF1614658.1 ATP-binding protein [Desulfurivibrio alkaliphilus]